MVLSTPPSPVNRGCGSHGGYQEGNVWSGNCCRKEKWTFKRTGIWVRPATWEGLAIALHLSRVLHQTAWGRCGEDLGVEAGGAMLQEPGWGGQTAHSIHGLQAPSLALRWSAPAKGQPRTCLWRVFYIDILTLAAGADYMMLLYLLP